jgi:penicillin-binding protein 2
MLLLDQLNKGDNSLRTVAWSVLAGMLILAAQLARLQVVSAEKYRATLQTQTFKTVRMPALRGKILARDGRELVGNAPRFRLDLYLDELRPQFQAEYGRLKKETLAARRAALPPAPTDAWSKFTSLFKRHRGGPRLTAPEIDQLQKLARFLVVSNSVASLNAKLGTQLAVSPKALEDHYLQRRFMPLPILPNCTPTQVALVTEQSWSQPGVALEQVAVRNYRYGPLAVHLLGHLKRNDAYDEQEGTFDYRLPDYSGAIGLEKSFDRDLRGVAGAKSILVNSAGYRHRQAEEILESAKPGLNLVTTLDLDLQLQVEKALNSVKNGDERGAVVVMNPNNGDVLAMASAPSFDPTEWLDPISVDRWNNYFTRIPERPMFNRASNGEYAPGSTFKIFSALAFLENGLNPAELFTVEPDPRRPGKGAYFIGNHPVGDTASPGEYNFRRAFIKSSNSYFIHYGLRLGWEKLLGSGHRFGLGDPTGIRIGEEKSGDFPTLEDVTRNNWGPGKLGNISIGQETTVTPLQLAVGLSAVANGGHLYWPRVVQRLEADGPLSPEPPVEVKPGQVRSEIRLPSTAFELVRSAMRDDVADSEGTGTGARVKDFAVCGKTGTAEIKGNGRKDKVTWFASFAPYEAPRYVVIVMVESGGSGGGTCAPVARQVYQFLHDRELGLSKGLASK